MEYVTLTAGLRNENLATHIETSGAYPLSGDWDWICLSPKKRMLPLDDIYKVADELKVIVYNQNDFVFAEEQARKYNPIANYFYNLNGANVSK
ncbi:MAG: hypothetical protein CM15mP59_4760 [Flavobacteriaceae bacterium]|nr:MAG: hypothetical protein CM15mP59_4760 [Flavobacteriaceae bacterium]